MMKQNETTANEESTRIEPTRIEELPAFLLAGVSIVTTNAAELSGNGKIGALYEQFYSHRVGDQLKEYEQQPGLYSCYYNYESDDAGQYEIMVGVKVKETSQHKLPDEISTFFVPAAQYAVFVTECGPIIEVVQQAWSRIWAWSKQSGVERAYTGDFEYYAQDIDLNNGQATIYIAIR